MKEILKKLFIQLYNTIFYRKIGRPNKQTPLHYFQVWYYILQTGISWRSLSLDPRSHINTLHWSTYYKKFNKLANIGFFKILHTCALRIAQKSNILNHQTLKTLFIDATLIKNINGIDLLGKNRCDRNRRGNKLTLIIADNGVPLAISLTTANQSDIQQLLPRLQNIKLKIIHSRLVADKGYISATLKKHLFRKKIYLIYPYRKNQQTIKRSHQSLLNIRYKIENSFARLQQFRKTRNRHEKHSFHFLQWYYFAITVLTTEKLE